jgi:hypothetical protein
LTNLVFILELFESATEDEHLLRGIVVSKLMPSRLIVNLRSSIQLQL